jgi:predicted RNA polymerase sigma factor
MRPPRLFRIRVGKTVSLYDTLISLRTSPIVALNRAIAIEQGDGPGQGLKELGAIPFLFCGQQLEID